MLSRSERERWPKFIVTPEQLNKILGDRLGKNPAGAPLYKWVNSDHFFHLMRKLDDFEERRSENGLVLIEPKYVHRKMVEADDIWLLAHWHAPESQYSWEMKYGPNLLWPREGFYAPVDVYLEPGTVPSMAVTEQVIEMVRHNRSKTYADHLADGDRIVERREKRQRDLISDIIDNETSAFCAVPGSKGHVSFPSVEKN